MIEQEPFALLRNGADRVVGGRSWKLVRTAQVYFTAAKWEFCWWQDLALGKTNTFEVQSQATCTRWERVIYTLLTPPRRCQLGQNGLRRSSFGGSTSGLPMATSQAASTIMFGAFP